MKNNTIRKVQRTRFGSRIAVFKVSDSAYCKRLEFNEPKDLNHTLSTTEKCEIRIVEFLNSINHLESYFGGFAIVGESIQQWCNELHQEAYEIAKLIRIHDETNKPVEFFGLLYDESSALEELLDAFPGPFDFETTDERTEQLLESFSDRLDEEIEITRKIGYHLYHVMTRAE